MVLEGYQLQFQTLLKEAILRLCETQLPFKNTYNIAGNLIITLDGEETFRLNVEHKLDNELKENQLVPNSLKDNCVEEKENIGQLNKASGVLAKLVDSLTASRNVASETEDGFDDDVLKLSLSSTCSSESESIESIPKALPYSINRKKRKASKPMRVENCTMTGESDAEDLDSVASPQLSIRTTDDDDIDDLHGNEMPLNLKTQRTQESQLTERHQKDLIKTEEEDRKICELLISETSLDIKDDKLRALMANAKQSDLRTTHLGVNKSSLGADHLDLVNGSIDLRKNNDLRNKESSLDLRTSNKHCLTSGTSNPSIPAASTATSAAVSIKKEQEVVSSKRPLHESQLNTSTPDKKKACLEASLGMPPAEMALLHQLGSPVMMQNYLALQQYIMASGQTPDMAQMMASMATGAAGSLGTDPLQMPFSPGSLLTSNDLGLGMASAANPQFSLNSELSELYGQKATSSVDNVSMETPVSSARGLPTSPSSTPSSSSYQGIVGGYVVKEMRHRRRNSSDVPDKSKDPLSKPLILKEVGTKKLLYQCQACGKMLKTITGFYTHYRGHTGEKPFICNTCGKGYADKSNLNKHTQSCMG